MNRTKVSLILGVITLLSTGFTNPETYSKFPGDYNLFKIDRSRDRDIVLYDVNLDSRGHLDTTMPISVYWEKSTQEGQFESLTGIQKKFGYGITFQRITENMAEFQIVSSMDRTFELRKSGDNTFRVYTSNEGMEVEVKSLYIYFEDDSFWFPAISKIELYGINTVKGGLVSEIITP